MKNLIILMLLATVTAVAQPSKQYAIIKRDAKGIQIDRIAFANGQIYVTIDGNTEVQKVLKTNNNVKYDTYFTWDGFYMVSESDGMIYGEIKNKPFSLKVITQKRWEYMYAWANDSYYVWR